MNCLVFLRLKYDLENQIVVIKNIIENSTIIYIKNKIQESLYTSSQNIGLKHLRTISKTFQDVNKLINCLKPGKYVISFTTKAKHLQAEWPYHKCKDKLNDHHMAAHECWSQVPWPSAECLGICGYGCQDTTIR